MKARQPHFLDSQVSNRILQMVVQKQKPKLSATFGNPRHAFLKNSIGQLKLLFWPISKSVNSLFFIKSFQPKTSNEDLLL
jgi:hypothetical protein